MHVLSCTTKTLWQPVSNILHLNLFRVLEHTNLYSILMIELPFLRRARLRNSSIRHLQHEHKTTPKWKCESGRNFKENVLILVNYSYFYSFPFSRAREYRLPRRLTRILLVCTRVLLVCYSCVTRMYLYVTRMLLVCTRMYMSVTRMLLVCTRMYFCVTRMLLVCTRVVKWLAHLPFTSKAVGSNLSENFSMWLEPSPHVKRVKKSTLCRKSWVFSGYSVFPPTGKVDRVG
jgi:hypothetical protein